MHKERAVLNYISQRYVKFVRSRPYSLHTNQSKHMSTILLLFLFVISVTATDTLNLFIFKRVDGFEFKVTSYTIEVIYGSNFSLICKMMRKSNEEAVNSHLIWRKKREKTKFSNLDDEFEYNIPGSNILNFTSVSVNDQGTYFCRSMKYGQFRKIQLVIKNALLKKSNHHFHKRDLNFSQILEENEKATKLWKEEQENKYNNYEESRGSSNSDSNRNTNTLSEDSTSDDTPLKVFYVFVAVVAMFVIIYVVTRCCSDTSQDQNTTSSSNSRPGRYRQYRSNVRIQQTGTNPGVCSHAACLEYQLEHHTQICLFDLGNAQGTNGFHSGVNQMVHGNSLDLPPTYQDTTANNSATGSTNNLNTVPDDGFSTRILNADDNDNSPLPPTYEDALVNIVLSEPPSYDTHNASQDYSRDNGGAAASNVAAGGNTGNDNSAGGNGDSGGGTGGDTGGGDSGGGGGDSGGGGGDSGGGGGDSGGGGGDD